MEQKVMNIHTIDELKDLNGKYVLVRDDFNVQIVDGVITDAFRIEQSLPTIRRLQSAGARVVIMSHFGRPKGKNVPELSLRPVACALEQLLGQSVKFVDDCLKRDFLGSMKNSDVAILENLRFYDQEENNDSEFAQKLSDGFDIYINDAFAVSHRAHASVDAITGFLPSFAGELLSSEINELNKLISNPKRPLVGIIGGAKVSSKVGVIKSLAKLCDHIIITGGIGTSFNIAAGANIKDMLWDESFRETCNDILKEFGNKITLSINKAVATEFSAKAARVEKKIDKIVDGDIILDEGELSVSEFCDILKDAKTVVWNGPLGMAEWQPTWSKGTFEIANYIAEKTERGEIESIVGGGDVVAALEANNTKDKMTYVSTGGGAFLEFIQGLELPGIKALEI
jgi:phosphoglycerate kinase